MTAQVIRERMAERTAKLSERVRATVQVVQVEKTQVIICVGPTKRGMGLSHYVCRRWQGRF